MSLTAKTSYHLLLALLVGALLLQTQVFASSKDTVVGQLRAGDVEALEQHFSAVQQAYKQGTIDDEKVLAEFRAFYLTEAAFEPKLNLWVQSNPKSYAARLARGIFHKYMGLKSRGDKFISETSQAGLRGMDASFQRSMDDLSASMQLDSKPLLSLLHAMDIAKHVSSGQTARQFLDLANEVDPANVIVRRKYLLTLQTRWGGSVEEMQAFVAECKQSNLPPRVLRDFQGQVELDAGWVYEHRSGSKDKSAGYAKAETQYLAAVPLLAEPETGWEAVGHMQYMQSKLPQAVQSFSRVLQRNPDHALILARRGHAFAMLKQPTQAFADYQKAAALGEPWAQNELGKSYWFGLGTGKNTAEAAKWFEKAVLSGNVEAKTNLEWARKLTRSASGSAPAH